MSEDGTRDLRGALARNSSLAALICVVVDVGGFLAGGPHLALSGRAWVVLVVFVVADACLAAPARFCGGVALVHAVTLVVTPLLLGEGGSYDLSNTGALVAGYLSGAWLRPAPAVASLVALSAATTANELLAWDGARGGAALFFAVLANGVLPWVVGRHTTTRRGHLAALEQRAERREHEEQMAVTRAVAEERSAIARDLHDVISHHVSAIAVHAAAARIAMPAGQSGGTGAMSRGLHAVETASRAAMLDLRRLLDLLHGRGDADAERQPGLNELGELLTGVRRAGLAVSFTSTGAGDLPDSLDLAMYRIAQESLTNALRHGGPGEVRVELDRGADGIVLTITNPLPAVRTWPKPSSPGRGLDGVRQRVALFEGEVELGPTADGRHWRVRARFPEEILC